MGIKELNCYGYQIIRVCYLLSIQSNVYRWMSEDNCSVLGFEQFHQLTHPCVRCAPLCNVTMVDGVITVLGPGHGQDIIGSDHLLGNALMHFSFLINLYSPLSCWFMQNINFKNSLFTQAPDLDLFFREFVSISLLTYFR